jgi:MarR family transcriptional regulator, 2-MHQ and catechol-resistance regulon repressor
MASEPPLKEAHSGIPRHHRPCVGAREKTDRAFQAYLDLLDTAEWLAEKMSRQLKAFEMTMMQFRVMDFLYREGPQYQNELCEKFETSKQNVWYVIDRLVGCGCLERVTAYLPRISPVRSGNASGQQKTKEPARGKRVMRVRLSVEGRRYIAYVSPRHRKVVKSELRALEGREQVTLSRILRKLRQGDPVRFLREIRMMEADEKPWGETD